MNSYHISRKTSLPVLAKPQVSKPTYLLEQLYEPMLLHYSPTGGKPE